MIQTRGVLTYLLGAPTSELRGIYYTLPGSAMSNTFCLGTNNLQKLVTLVNLRCLVVTIGIPIN